MVQLFSWLFIFNTYAFEVFSAETPLFVTTPEDSTTSGIEGFGTDLKCLINTCKTPAKKIKWYKDDKVITADGVSHKDRYFVKHNIVYDTKKDCSGPCSSGSSCRVGEHCLGNSCCGCASEEFTLAISNLTSSDAGIYRCSLEPGGNAIEIRLTVLDGASFPTFNQNLSFDHTVCCMEQKMSAECLPLCKPRTLVTQRFDPVPCQKQFHKLLHCATEGGNISHVHCCRLNFVPPFCWQYCSGSLQENQRTNRLCVYWMPEILFCYDRAYAPFPGPPEQVVASNINSTSVELCWNKPKIRGDTIDYYTVRYQEVPKFPFLVGNIPFMIDDSGNGGLDHDDDDIIEHSIDKAVPMGSLIADEISAASLKSAPILIDSKRKKRQSSLIISTHNTATNETEFREFKYTEINTTNSCLTIDKLKPSTQYSMYVVSTNYYGSSLASLRQNVITLAAYLPNVTLPNVKECCIRNNVEQSCMSKLCDVENPPSSSGAFNLAFICRKEFGLVAPCLADGRDHTRCCKERSVGGECLKLCNGTVSSLGMASILCLSLDIQSIYLCYREGYATLPSPPVNVTLLKRSSTTALLSWQEPLSNVQKVISYSLFYRQNNVKNFIEAKNVTSSYLLTNLWPDTTYDVYVIAHGIQGSSLRSSIIMFTTDEPEYDNVCKFGKILRDVYDQPFLCGLDNLCPPLYLCTDNPMDNSERMYCCPSEQFIDKPSTSLSMPNITSCCISNKIEGRCLNFCTYDISISRLKFYALDCVDHLPIYFQCAGGNRNNSECCLDAGISTNDFCMDLCNLSFKKSSIDYLNCVNNSAKFIKCNYEGMLNLPPSVENLRLEDSGANWATVGWDRPLIASSPAKRFQFFIWDPTIAMYKEFNTSGLSITISDLKHDVAYSAHVVSWNNHGSSLPSLKLQIKLQYVESSNLDDSKPRPPTHVEKMWFKNNTANVTWHWINRSVTNRLIEKYKFKVHFKQHIADRPRGAKWTIVNTTDMFIILRNLTTSATYDVKLTAVNYYKDLESVASETLNFLALEVREVPRIEIITDPESSISVVGDNITVICRGYGDPMPSMTLKQFTMILATSPGRVAYTFHNITAFQAAEPIYCLADNGASVISQRLHLLVKYKPIVAFGDFHRSIIEDIPFSLYCRVQGYPKPKVAWYFRPSDVANFTNYGTAKPISNLMPVIGSKHLDRIAAFDVTRHENVYNASLQLLHPRVMDSGTYYCVACTSHLGCSNASVKVTVDPYVVPRGPDYIYECCKEQHVSIECISACTPDIMPQVYDKRCVTDFTKLLKCAKDGIDYKRCCSRTGVPDECLTYCSPDLLIDDSSLTINCAKYRSDVVTCIQDSHIYVSSPPSNLAVNTIESPTKLNITWQPPLVNAASVLMYVLYYKGDGDKNYTQVRTDKMFVFLDRVDPNKSYQFSAIAVNKFGFSAFSKLVNRRIAGGLSDDDAYPHGSAMTALAIIVCLLLAALLIVAVIHFTRHPQRWPLVLSRSFRRAFKGSSYWSGGGVLSNENGRRHDAVAFENPGYDTDGRIIGLPGDDLTSASSVRLNDVMTMSSKSPLSDDTTSTSSPNTTPQKGMRYTQLK